MSGIFNLDEVFLFVGEVFKEVVEKLGELFDGFLRDTDGLGSEELGEDSAELDGLLSFHHLEESLVEVAGELDEASWALRELFEEGEDSIDGFNGGVKLIIDDMVEVGVFGLSLDCEILDDSVDGLDVSFSLSLVSFGGSKGVFAFSLSGFRVGKSILGIANFLGSEANFVGAVNRLGVPQVGVGLLFISNGIFHVLDLSHELISSVVFFNVFG